MNDDTIDVARRNSSFVQHLIDAAEESFEQVVMRCQRLVRGQGPVASTQHHVGKGAADIDGE